MRSLVLAFFFLSVWLSALCAGQNPPPQIPGSFPHQPPVTTDDSEQNPNTVKLQKEMEKKANQERQLQLKRDTDKLLQLSTELKQYVDKTNPNVLSLDVIKKADEIEKLARSVKDKMKGGS